MVAIRASPWDPRVRTGKWKRDSNLNVIKGVVHRATPLSGLKTTLFNVLWPTYTFDFATRKSEFGLDPETGAKIENQVDTYYDEKDAGKKPKRPGRYEARIFIALMEGNGLTRVAKQGAIAYGNIGTRFDWIFEDKNGKQYLIELKTGHNKGMNKVKGQILDEFPSNRKYHAYFQLLWMWAVLEKRGIETEPWLVVINKTVKKKFRASDTIKYMAERIREKKVSRIFRPLPQDVRKVKDTVLELIK